jgi:DNA-binding NarL/FixJ family response regulator
LSGSYLRPVSQDSAVAAGRPKRVVFVDESALYAESWRAVLACRYGPAVSFESYRDPIAALDALGPDVTLLLVDLELPLFGGRKMFELAKERGVACRRIVILSSRPAEDLHQLFPEGSCLAVINKTEPNQQNAFLMILDSIVKRH